MKPNPNYRPAKHGEVVGSGFDENGIFVEKWNEILQKVEKVYSKRVSYVVPIIHKRVKK